VGRRKSEAFEDQALVQGKDFLKYQVSSIFSEAKFVQGRI
jgi:hypothetical protein